MQPHFGVEVEIPLNQVIQEPNPLGFGLLFPNPNPFSSFQNFKNIAYHMLNFSIFPPKATIVKNPIPPVQYKMAQE